MRIKRRLLRKLVFYPILGLLSLILLMGVIFSLLLINIHHFDKQIKKTIFEKTGFELNFSKIQGKFNLKLQPEVIIDNLTVSKSHNPVPFFRLQKFDFAISNASLYKMTFILGHLELRGSTDIIEYDKNENLIVNQQIIANLKPTKAPSPFNVEAFLLQQQDIHLSDLDIMIINSKDKLKPIHLKAVDLRLDNPDKLNHSLIFKSQNRKSDINLLLKLHGTKLSEVSSWQDGDLILTNKDKFNHSVDIKAKVKDGRLLFLDADFDTIGRQVLSLNNAVESNTVLSGQIKVEEDTSGRYSINGKNLIIRTESGYFLNHATLSGSYKFGQAGDIHLSGFSLDGLSSFRMTQLSDKLVTRGDINNINFKWYGRITKPDDFILNAQLNNIAVVSQESNTPSIDKINGDVIVKPKSGTLNLSLLQSKVTFPKQLKQPITITKFINTTNWAIESHNQFKLVWKDSLFETKDFSVLVSGDYDSNESHINLHAKTPKLPIPMIPNYLPQQNMKEVISFIKDNMPKGSLNNLDLQVNGDVTKIPFSKGGGELKFTAQYNDVTLKFAPDFAPGEHLTGTILSHNQGVTLKLNSGNLGKFNVSKTNIAAPDLFADNILVNLDGYGSGQTADFIDYLRLTPLKTAVDGLPKKMTISGPSEVFLKLKLPTSTPKKMDLSGNWHFQNNNFSFDSSLPSISNINGRMNFSGNGIKQSNFTANVLNSNIELSLSDKQIIQLYWPDLDYSTVMQFYFKGRSKDLLQGRAMTKVTYSVKDSSTEFYTDLRGVSINAVTPLSKSESDVREVTIHTHRLPGNNGMQVDVNYAKIFFAAIDLSEKMEFKQAKIGIGTDDYYLKHQNGKAPLTIRANLLDFNINNWLAFAKKLQGLTSESTNVAAHAESNSPAYATNAGVADNKTSVGRSGVYPVQIELATKSIWYNNYNIDGGSIDILVNESKVNGKIDTPSIAGQCAYEINQNKLDLSLSHLLISTSNFMNIAVAGPNKISTESNIEPTHKSKTKAKVPDINLSIQDLYYQDHYLGSLKALVLQRNNALYIESFALNDKASSTKLRLIDHYATAESTEYTELRVRTQIYNFGALINKLDFGNDIRQGNGMADLSLNWSGGVEDFNMKKAEGIASLSVKKGEFRHINPGLLGSLFGVVSLTSITGVTSLNMNTFFGKGFAFDSLDTYVEILNDQIKIKNLKLVGTSATIKTFGKINLTHNTIDSYLTVEPRLGATVATTAGIVTLNPIVGVIVYAGQAIVGNPVNKLLAINYHITGDIENPTMEKTDLSDQIIHNFNSSTGSLQHPVSAISNIQINQ